MNKKRRWKTPLLQALTFPLLAAALTLPGTAWSQAPTPQYRGSAGDKPPTQHVPAAPDADEAKLQQMIVEGVNLLRAGRQAEAISLQFDRVISAYEAKFNDPNVDYYCARHQGEALLYLVQAASGDKKRNALVVSLNWALAYYFKGYAFIELKRLADARPPLERAVALSPQNAQFLGELGYYHQTQKDWPGAYALFKRAEEAARGFSPPELRNKELARAWRGMGYALIEMKRLDEAEALYRKCLELDANDALAQHELRYLLSLKAKHQ